MPNKQYVLGRGRVFFDQFAPNTQTTTGERYIGNTPEFSLTIESESLDHFDADAGIRAKDDSVLLELNRTGSFVTDNIDIDNLALFFLGAKSTAAQASVPSHAEIITGVRKDRYYQIGSALRVGGVRNVSSVVLTKEQTPTDVPMVLGTDYTLEASLGRFYIMPTSTVVVDGDTVNVACAIAAYSQDRVITAGSSTVDGALKFIANNPKGPQRDYYMPYVRLSPNGDYALKGDEWQQFGFTIDVQKLSDTVESIYVDGRPYTP